MPELSATADSARARALLDAAGEHESAGRPLCARALYAAAIGCDEAHRAELAAFLARNGDFEECRREWGLLLAWAQRRGDAATEAAACRSLAALCRELREFAAAASWQQRAFSVLFDSGQAACLSPQDLIARASDWLAAGELTDAERLLCRVIEAARAARDTESEADAWGTLGLVHGRRGVLTSAARCLQRAAALHRRCGDLRGAAADFLNLGEVFRVSGRLVAARQCLRRAVAAAVRARDPQRWSTATARLREVERIQSARTCNAECN